MQLSEQNASKHCQFTYNSLFYNKGNVAHCCMQDTLHKRYNWESVNDLNQFYLRDEFQEVRQALAQGIKHSACDSCWAYEENGMPSMRQQNMYYKNNFNTKTNIKHVDIRLSNKCNLQCKMCNSGDSDQIHRLALDLTDTPYNRIVVQNNDTKKFMDLVLELPDLEAVRLAGGEPFIMPEVEQFLYKLVILGKTDINIEIITNCTSAKPRIIQLLNHFKRVDIMCSIDGVGETLEYQRFPARWKTIENNFVKLYNSNCNIRIVPCIGILNYLTLDKFFEWANQFPDALVTYNEIQEPEFFNFRFIPASAREDFYERFANTEFANAAPQWRKFQKRIMRETKEPTVQQCNELLHHVTSVWDVTNEHKFLELYPWAEYMIEKAND